MTYNAVQRDLCRSDGRALMNCTECGEDKPSEDFYWKDEVRGYRQSRCKTCTNSASRSWRAANLDRVHAAERELYLAKRDYHMRRRLRRSARDLGLDPDVIEAYYEAHNGLCDSCGRSPQEAAQANARLCLDHDHSTGEFRGLLCRDCNLMLGNAADDPKRLILAADYLERVKVA